MATLQPVGKLSLQVQFTLDEQEARALAAIARFDPEAFVKALATHLTGDANRHAAGLISFYRSVVNHLDAVIEQADKADAVYRGRLLAPETVGEVNAFFERHAGHRALLKAAGLEVVEREDGSKWVSAIALEALMRSTEEPDR